MTIQTDLLCNPPRTCLIIYHTIITHKNILTPCLAISALLWTLEVVPKTVKLQNVVYSGLMHQSPVSPAPPPSTYRDGRGIARLTCGPVTFWVPPQCLVSAVLVTLRKYTPMESTIIKSWAMTRSRSPQCRAFSRALPLNPTTGKSADNDFTHITMVSGYDRGAQCSFL